MSIDPGVITLVQTTFLQHLNTAFGVIAHYAMNLLYIFATLEIVMFGLIFALQRDASWGQLLFKIIKIALIFFIIQNYTWLLDIVIKSFAELAGVVINNAKVSKILFNPANIWQYGYDAGLHLLQVAALGNNFSLAMIQIFLGIGVLFVFGLLGIQIILQISAFYLVALAGLILLPFGMFNPSRRMFDKAVQAVLQAGIRVMILVIVIGIAVTVWNTFDLSGGEATVTNIANALGLFFSGLLFLCLAIYLPRVAADAVGTISSFSLGAPAVSITGGGGQISPTAMSAQNLAAMQVATSVAAGNMPGASAVPAQVSTAAAIQQTAQPQTGAAVGLTGDMRSGVSAKDAATISKSISESTIRQIKDTLVKTINEKPS